MIINLQNNGQSQILTPDHLYKGSAGVNTISIIGALSSSTAVSVAFILPSGVKTVYAPAALIGVVNGVVDTSGALVYEWQYTLPLNILSESGQVGVAVNTLATNGNQTSYVCSFTVENSVLPDLPEQPDEDVYELLLQYIAADEATILNLKKAVFGVNSIPTNDSGYLINLNPRVTQIELDVASAETDITHLQGDVSGLDTKVYNVESGINQLGLRVTSNETDIATIEGNITTLSGRVTTAEGDISDLKASDTEQNTRLGDIETDIGTADIQDIAPSITEAINSLNEDIDALQNGVVPRINRGIIEYPNPTQTPDSGLVTALNAYIQTQLGRTPDNTDKMTVQDSEGDSEGTYYTYNYWKGYTEVTNGWYWDSISVTAPVNDVPSYAQNVLLNSWGTSVDGMYNIVIPAATHGQGTTSKITVEFKTITASGSFEPVNLWRVDTSGNVTLYTDTPFVGSVVIKSSNATYLTSVVLPISQVEGLQAELNNLQSEIDEKAPLIQNTVIINSQAEFDDMIANNTWGVETILNADNITVTGTLSIPAYVSIFRGVYKPIGTSELDKLSITITLPSATGDEIVGLKLNHQYTKVKDVNINVHYFGADLNTTVYGIFGDFWNILGGIVTQLENIYLIVHSVANTNKGFGGATSINNCVAGSERDTSETKTFVAFYGIDYVSNCLALYNSSSLTVPAGFTTTSLVQASNNVLTMSYHYL